MSEILPYRMGFLIFLRLLCLPVAFLLIFRQRKEPRAVWAWLLLLYTFPLVGLFAYFLMGTDAHKRNIFKVREMEEVLCRIRRQQEERFRNGDGKWEKQSLLQYRGLLLYNLQAIGGFLTERNEITLFTDGKEKYGKLMEDMKEAKSFIHIQYYVIKNDVLFYQLWDILKKKVQEGVEVRILCDALGCHHMPRRVWKQLKQEGVQIAEFFPPPWKPLYVRFNYRNHRKLVILDNRVGYVGGFNIGREYVGLHSGFGNWRDTHMRITGGGVAALQLRFLMDWNAASAEKVSLKKYCFLPEMPLYGSAAMQIISSGPDSPLPHIRNNYLRLIAGAKEMLSIQTPYFIPDEAILSQLKLALHSGVRVRLMIPCKPDHPFVYRATMSFAGELLMEGAECYIYREGFLHAKGVIADRTAYCYGTANLDIRSFTLNFEVNVVVYGEEETEKMLEIFEKDLQNCKRLTKEEYQNRSLRLRAGERLCRLLSPLL